MSRRLNHDVMNLTEINPEEMARKAMELKASGNYNCAQAVACAFAQVIGSDEQFIYNATNAFGRGMGCMEATCGALTGAGVIIGLATGDRVKAMKCMADVLKRFESNNGATICRQLKGIKIDPQSGHTIAGQSLRPCNLCVSDAALYLAERLSEMA